MFFHHDKLSHFIHELAQLEPLFHVHKFTDRGYQAISTSIKEPNVSKFIYFHKHVLPVLKKETDEIDSHIKSEETILKAVHKSIIYKVLAVKMENLTVLTKEEQELHVDLVALHNLHEPLSQLLKKTEELFEKKAWGYADKLQEDIKELIDLLKRIKKISIKIGTAMKQILKELKEAEDLIKKDKTDFKRNMKSWINLTE